MIRRLFNKRNRRRILLGILLILLVGFLLPQQFVIPVEGASPSDWNPESFWYYPWGRSVTHKGVDIFAQEGAPVLSASGGLVLYAGELSIGGNVIVVLGPKWRLHYYAHLSRQDVKFGNWTHVGEQIGAVGTSGNAAGKQAHLHYSIGTPIPYFWRIDGDRQGWKKMFYLNPLDYMAG